MVECHLAKVDVAGSNPVSRSDETRAAASGPSSFRTGADPPERGRCSLTLPLSLTLMLPLSLTLTLTPDAPAIARDSPRDLATVALT